MVDPIKISQATDLDAEYILRRITAAEEHEAKGNHSKETATKEWEQATQARLEAGKRLIEVHNKFSDNSVSDKKPGRPKSDFKPWLEANGIAVPTAYRLMTAAGFTEEQRKEHKKKEATKKREKRAKKFSIGWRKLITQRCGKKLTAGDEAFRLKKKLEEVLGEAVPERINDPALAERIVQAYIQLFGLQEKVVKQPTKDELREQDKHKLEKAIKQETDKLQAEFWKQVNAQLPEQQKILAEQQEKLNAQIDIYASRNAHLNALMTLDDYRLILSCLHPDRVPKDLQPKYAKAFDIMRRLGDQLTK